MTATIQNPNSTYTELNRGVNGSKMDESTIVQVDPVTFATVTVHRERVVIGLDNGDLVGPPELNGVDLNVWDRRAYQLLESIDATLKAMLEVLLSRG